MVPPRLYLPRMSEMGCPDAAPQLPVDEPNHDLC